jgi:hypothetical protein
MEHIWKPLEALLGKNRCAGFMYMGRVNGINLYKHGIARSYLNLDDAGQCYLSRRDWRFERADFDTELRKLEDILTRLGETLESVYDDSYIEQKRQALEKMGIQLLRIEIEPETVSIV